MAQVIRNMTNDWTDDQESRFQIALKVKAEIALLMKNLHGFKVDIHVDSNKTEIFIGCNEASTLGSLVIRTDRLTAQVFGKRIRFTRQTTQKLYDEFGADSNIYVTQCYTVMMGLLNAWNKHSR